jgi:uncharacterized membrane protein
MKKNYISLIMLIAGIGIILTGITLTVIPLFNFDVFTFNLGQAMVYALGFSFVGIVLIILSVIYNSLFSSKDTKSTEEIAKTVKESLEKEKQPKICPYCGNKLKQNTKKCSNCGAEVK